MKNWKEKIVNGDIANAARNAGVGISAYYRSKETPVEKWTPAMIKVNTELKKLVIERESQRAEFAKN